MRLKYHLLTQYHKNMPVLIGVLLVGAVGGYFFSNSASSTLSNLEGIVVGAAIGIGAAAVYFSIKKI